MRVDLREKVDNLLSRITDLAKALDCVIFIPESELLIESNVFALGKSAAESNAAKFVKDPEEFLSNLGADANAT